MANDPSIKEYSLRELFNDCDEDQKETYLIPIYQRNYAWGSEEIQQLIEDVTDYAEKNKHGTLGTQNLSKRYYIGTLVVYRRADGSYEVIDGQQRLTTLFLMLCDYQKKGLETEGNRAFSLAPNKLVFENRQKSTVTLRNIVEYAQSTNEYSDFKQDTDESNNAIIAGFEMIQSTIKEKILSSSGHELTAQDFFNYLLDNVMIYRIQLPENTDLNHYFEVMNSRGEQLEKHEIIKARFLSKLLAQNTEESELDRKVFAQVWDAVANMNHYVQYGFTTTIRNNIFGDNWGCFIPRDYAQLKEMISNSNEKSSSDKEDTRSRSSLAVILENVTQYSSEDISQSKDNETPDRFNSVIQFPAFLLHVLKIWSVQQDVSSSEKPLHISLDDKQLIQAFDACFFESPDTEQSLSRIQTFTYLLLKTKYLFDHYVIKREYTEHKEHWSLQYLCKSKDKKENSGYLKNSFQEKDGADIHKQILMLQSAFHVSMPTQNYKYWLLGALYYLVLASEKEADSDIHANDYLQALEAQAERFMFEGYVVPEAQSSKVKTYEEMIFSNDLPDRFLETLSPQTIAESLRYGNIRNNFVFNYLDYRLWRSIIVEGKELDTNRGEKRDVYRDFVFTFRSSVEHFYPQNPYEGHSNLPLGALHAFGNLCLLSSSKNSRLNNRLPDDKKAYFEKGLKKNAIDSLKLYKMIMMLDSERNWVADEIQQHEKDMLEILMTPINNKK